MILGCQQVPAHVAWVETPLGQDSTKQTRQHITSDLPKGSRSAGAADTGGLDPRAGGSQFRPRHHTSQGAAYGRHGSRRMGN